MNNIITKILLGDSQEVLKKIDDNIIDLIVTSPPYADRRKNTYGGIGTEKYAQIINKLTLDFSQNFCDDGNINWAKLVEYNSGFGKIKHKSR